MPAGTELVGPDLMSTGLTSTALRSTEFADPVGYSLVWPLLAAALVVLVVGFYVGVWAWAGEPDPVEKAAPDAGIEPARSDCTRRLQGIERDVHSGRMPPRRGFQELSATVRAFVQEASGLPATAMALEDLRASGDRRLAEAIALMYPREFAPDEAISEEFRASLQQARELVTSWS